MRPAIVDWALAACPGLPSCRKPALWECGTSAASSEPSAAVLSAQWLLCAFGSDVLCTSPDEPAMPDLARLLNCFVELPCKHPGLDSRKRFGGIFGRWLSRSSKPSRLTSGMMLSWPVSCRRAACCMSSACHAQESFESSLVQHASNHASDLWLQAYKSQSARSERSQMQAAICDAMAVIKAVNCPTVDVGD